MRARDGFDLCLAVRADPRLGGVPVVLLSSWYTTEADRELARRAGASLLVTRTPNLDELAPAIAEALARPVPRLEDQLGDQLRLDHARVVLDQLHRQLDLGATLARRCTLQAAQISLLSGVAAALTRKVDGDTALRDVLAATLDAVGMSKGALFLRDDRGALILRQEIGFTGKENEALPYFFGEMALLDSIVEQQAVVTIPSANVDPRAAAAIMKDVDVAALQVVSLVAEAHGAGAIVLGTRTTDVSSEDAIAFARAMGNQIAQSIELTSSFQRLAASEHRYRTLMENANDGISILTPDGVIREANRRLAEMFGYPAEELIGKTVLDLAAPGSESDNVRHYGQSVAAGSGRSPAIPIRRGDGETVLVEFSTTSVEIGGEQLVLSVGRDVTDQLGAQAKMMVSDRMASMGTLAAGVAHEINNPLAAIIANLDLAAQDVAALEGQLGGTADLGELGLGLREARDAAERVRNIVRDIRMFSRVDEERRGAIDCHRVIDSSLRIAANEIRHRARLVKDYGTVPLVHANESRLGQVFLNLVVNAAQAIPEGYADANEIRVRTRVDEPRGRVIVEVSDTGSGIAPEAMKKLFTPFFTTKPIGVGTGLGLAICHRIVSDMGGDIAVSSQVGVGTTFRVSVPVAPTDAAEAPAPAPAATARRRGHVLVVDDERSICNVIRRMLGAEHDVDGVTSAMDALRRVGAGERFDVIFCDLMMPVMTGMDLHAELARLAPDQAERMVFLTGGAFTARARAFLDEATNPRVEKPFELATLRDLVNARV
jgi:PAS domain S-box-containing protein